MIRVDPAKCSGCSRCEVNCSFFHSGRIGRSGARIKVVKIEAIGIDFPVVCQHCRERYCTKCPQEAIELGPFGQVIVSPTLCTACGTCESLCPIGAIEITNEIPHVCDLCGGDPRCVQQCPMSAITFHPRAGEPISLSAFKSKATKLSPEAKRVRFVLASTENLRRKWLRKERDHA